MRWVGEECREGGREVVFRARDGVMGAVQAWGGRIIRAGLYHILNPFQDQPVLYKAARTSTKIPIAP